MNVHTGTTRIVDVRALPADGRAALLARFDAELFRPAFPDDNIREDPQVWLDLMAADPGPPAPIVAPLIALGPGEEILGGIVIEFYRRSKSAFLTYIVTSPKAQRQGLATKLAAAAFEAVRALNGGVAPVVFAEAERPEDMTSKADRLHAEARLEILHRMGAVRAELDYVQPPLAPGLDYRRLHLLAAKASLPDGGAVPSAQVLGLLDELFRALDLDPDTDAAFKSMAAQLAKEPTVRFTPLSEGAPRAGAKTPMGGERAATHAYRESPVFTDIDSFSFGFIFELRIERPKRSGPERALRLEAIHRAIDPDAPGVKRSPREQEEARRVFGALVEPLESFHDDVTTGPPGHGGRPFVFSAEGQEDVSAGRTIEVVRPARWRFVAEGRHVEMHAPADEAARTHRIEFRDSFCAFESGRLFYFISLTPAPGSAIDEYLALQLTKLGYPSFATEGLREQLRFRWSGGDYSLIELVNARLAALSASKDPAPNGLRDVIRKWILDRGDQIAPLDWTRLRGVVNGIENDRVFQTVKETRDAKDVFADNGREVLEAGPSNIDLPVPPPQTPEDFPDPLRRALAITAILQGVPDFAFQGGPEIYDSTREIHGDDGETMAIFSHPGFIVQISCDWRELRDAHGCLGHCPYMTLTWFVAAHDETIVKEMEERLSDLIYDWKNTEARSAEPVQGLRRTLRIIRKQILPGPSPALRRSLLLRLELFRRLTVNRSTGYIFRYPAEANVFRAMIKARGIAERFERALALLDRYSGIVEDVQELGRMESDRRLNMVLGLVALMGVISVVADWSDARWWPFGSGDPTTIVLMAAGGVLAFLVAWLLIVRFKP